MFLGGGWFCAASTLCAVAPTAGLLIGARAFQGVGATLMTPGSLAIVQSALTPADRARAIGAWSALTGVPGAAGRLRGGYLTDALSWRAIFLINVPVGGAVVLRGHRHLPKYRDAGAAHPPDLPGALLGAVSLAALAYGLIEAAGSPAASPQVMGAGLLAAGAAAGFGRRERSNPHPMLPLELFASARFVAANVVTFVVYTAATVAPVTAAALASVESRRAGTASALLGAALAATTIRVDALTLAPPGPAGR